VASILDGTILMWMHIQKELKAKNLGFVFGVVQYGLTPQNPYPTQLRQAILSLSFVLSKGIKPSNIALAGESAGGHLILGLLSHMLHPIPNLPEPPKLSTPLAGAYIMSPWVSLTGDTGSYEKFSNPPQDMFVAKTVGRWGRTFLSAVPAEQLPWVTFSPQAITKAGLEPKTTETWWHGVSDLCSRFLITAGDLECLRDDIVEFSGLLEKQAKPDSVRLVVQRNGIHIDPVLSFGTGDGERNDLVPISVAWLAACYRGE
jgi:acetyl esterase/lipase